MNSRTYRIQKKDIGRFADFGDQLYMGDSNYTPYMRRDLIRTLTRLVCCEKSYCGLLTENENGKILARVLLTVDSSKRLRTERCGYFCLYECVDDFEVSREILSEAALVLREMGAEYMCGPFSPFDPDNRRGLLVKGFDTPPMLFTSYNFPYYEQQMQAFGFSKQVDANSYRIPLDRDSTRDNGRRVEKLAEFVLKRNDYYVTSLDPENLSREVTDLHSVMTAASTEINYQEVLSLDEMAAVVKEWKSFLDPRFILFAREKSSNAPVGVAVALPDYSELIRRMQGKSNPAAYFRYFRWRRKITGLRAVLQYVIPAYQSRGAAIVLYNEMRKAVEAAGFCRMELGTIMEDNRQSNTAIEELGGELYRIYRLYEKRL